MQFLSKSTKFKNMPYFALIMVLKKCDFCKNEVPEGGQCNKCGFIDGLRRQPTDDEFRIARKINEKEGYKQFSSIDMMLLD